MRRYRLLTSNQQRLHPTMRFLKFSVLFVLLLEGCKKPSPPKAEKKESVAVSGYGGTKPARPSESQPVAKPQGANAPRSGKREKSAADWISVLKDTDAARRIQ